MGHLSVTFQPQEGVPDGLLYLESIVSKAVCLHISGCFPAAIRKSSTPALSTVNRTVHITLLRTVHRTVHKPVHRTVHSTLHMIVHSTVNMTVHITGYRTEQITFHRTLHRTVQRTGLNGGPTCCS